MPVGYVAAAAGVASAVNNIANSGSSAPANQTYGGNPATYIPAAQPQADQLYQNIFNQMAPYASSLPGQVIPGYQAYVSNIQNNPYAGQAQAGANQVASTGQTVGGYDLSNAGQLNNLGGQIATTAFDPQSALYNRLQNQVAQQAAAANAASGVSGPYAAGTTDQALTNFNIDWQNQQLQRQIQGEQAAGQAYSGAANLGNAGISTYGTTSLLPYSTYLSQQQNDLAALSSLTSGYNAAFGPDQATANLLQSYLGLGQSATGLAQAGQQAGFNQDQTTSAQLGQSLSGLKGIGSDLSGLFGSSTPSSGYMGYGPSGYSPQIGDYSSAYTPISGGSAGGLTFAGM